MSERRQVAWSNVEAAATRAFDVWTSGSDFEWAKRAWALLASQGLTAYSSELERCRVLIRFISLAVLHRTFCDIAWEEPWEWDECELEAWISDLGLSSFKSGCLAGEKGLVDKDVEEDAEDFNLTMRTLLMLSDEARPEVFHALRDGSGGVEQLYGFLCQSTASEDEDLGENDKPIMKISFREIMPDRRMAAFSWVDDGCHRLR